MKPTIAGRLSCWLLPLALSIINLSAAPLGTAFTYQGRLVQGGNSASGWYDFQFGLWDDSTGGNQYGTAQTVGTVGVTNGLFSVAVDFGSVFNGNTLWLEIAARTNGASAFTKMTPRQLLTATPYANYSPLAGGAGVASLANAVAPGSITTASLAPGAATQLGAPGGTLTNAVQVNTNGWVGVGTNNPNAALEVTGGSALLGLTVYAAVPDGTDNATNLAGACGLAVSGNLLAVAAAGDNSVTLFDSSANSLTWHANMQQGQGSFTNLNRALGVAISPNNLLAVAAWGSSAVTLVDVSNPDNPVWRAALVNGIGGWNDLAGASAVAFKTNLLAIASSNANAVILADVSNPAAPVQKVVLRNGTFGFNYLGMPNGLAFSTNLLAISSWSSNAVTLVDVSNPTSPVLKAVLNSANGFTYLKAPWSVAIDNGLMAVGCYANDLVALVDISNPTSPMLRAVLQNNANGISSFVSPLGLAYLHRNNRTLLAVSARDSDRLMVFDVTDPAHPILRGNFPPHTMGLHNLRSPRFLAFNANGQLALETPTSLPALTLVGLLEEQAGVVSDTWVGIGTASPRAALDVVGDVLVENANRFEVHTARIEMGTGASATGLYATAIGDGVTAGGNYSTAFGYQNTASGDLSTVLGYANTASGKYSTALGFNTTASGAGSMAAGSYAMAVHNGSFVWSDYDYGSYFSSTASDQFLIHASNGVGINKNNPTVALDVNGNLSASGIGIGTAAPQDGVLDVEGDTHINDHDLFLRGGIDRNHGLGWYGNTKLFADQNVDGPILYGFSGGGLGTKSSSGDRVALAWDAAGRASVDPGNLNTGSVSSASLTFGSGSGEGIASRRGSSPVQYTLDFYTSYIRRMSLFNNGSVTIGGTNAEHTLDVTGDVGIRGGLGINTKDQQDPNWPFLPAIIFGDFSTSGEYITSQRGPTGSNRWGLDFYTQNSRRLIIANNGWVGIGRQPTGNSLEVAGNASKDSAGSWLANSDARIKQDIQTVTDALDTLDRVRLVSFRYTDDYRRTHPGIEDRPYVNVVAQEFREVFPHEVKSSGERLSDGNEILQVDTYPLIIYSAAALQELNQKNQKLEKALETKEAEIQELKQRLDRLERAFEQHR